MKKHLLSTFLFLIAFQFVNAQIVISEIMYNNAGADDLEFVELYNSGATMVDLNGWTFDSAFQDTLNNVTLAAGDYLVIAVDATAFNDVFGFMPEEIDSGNMNNTGEEIQLYDASGALMDNVMYADSGGWPGAADGTGPSLVLCDVATDNNDPANWLQAFEVEYDFFGAPVFANPGAAPNCPTGPIISFLGAAQTVSENVGTVTLTIVMQNGDASTTSFDILPSTASTATPGDDFLPSAVQTLSFASGLANDTMQVVVDIIDDTEMESQEIAAYALINPTNGGTIVSNGALYSISIVDNDTPLTNSLLITGVYDAQPGGAGAKGVELYALQDIPDMSIFGIRSANNGEGPGDPEFTFPADAVTAGQCIYVAADGDLFMNWFGFAADYVQPAANINGDDAIEIFENGMVIDVFGEISVDGSGEPWEYLDGWAYRDPSTGPDGATFIFNNWSFSGIDALEGVADNASAANPFPTCSYSSDPIEAITANDDMVSTTQDVSVTIDVSANDVIPTDVTPTISITALPANGTALVNADGMIEYSPNAGYCGLDMLTYESCNPVDNVCASATVAIDVICPTDYTEYDVVDLTVNDAQGVPTLDGQSVSVTGIVHGIDLQGMNDDVSFTLIDNTGGIAIYSSENYGYEVLEGNTVTVNGELGHFNGLTQIRADQGPFDNIVIAGPDQDPVTPAVVTVLNEVSESEIVKLMNLTVVSVTPTGTSGENILVSNGTDEFTIRVDSDVEIFEQNLPALFNASGIGGQFDNAEPFDEGYQLLPRYWADIEAVIATNDQELGSKIKLFPNPTSEQLRIVIDADVESFQISNLLGQNILTVTNPETYHTLDVVDFENGIYIISFLNKDKIYTTQFVKQ